MSINGKQEKLLDNYPKPIDNEKTSKILKQMKYSVCKIYILNNGQGTGFFCNIIYDKYKIPVLITNNHIIDKNYIKEEKFIKLTLFNDKYDRDILLDNKRIYYSNKNYDTTLIEIFPKKDDIKDFLELDEKLLNNNSETYYGKNSIYVIQYPKEKKVSVSYGILNSINYIEKTKSDDIYHFCSTEDGSSGSPILKIDNNKVIGVHKEGIGGYDFNIGTFLRKPIMDFLGIVMKQNKLNKYININSSLEKEISLDESNTFYNDKLTNKEGLIDIKSNIQTEVVTIKSNGKTLISQNQESINNETIKTRNNSNFSRNNCMTSINSSNKKSPNIEKSKSKNHSVIPENEKTKNISKNKNGLVGLSNKDKPFCINAFLQCLSNIKRLRKFFYKKIIIII